MRFEDVEIALRYPADELRMNSTLLNRFRAAGADIKTDQIKDPITTRYTPRPGSLGGRKITIDPNCPGGTLQLWKDGQMRLAIYFPEILDTQL